MNAMHRPIRHRLFGGIEGRQASAAGWAASRPLEWGAVRSVNHRREKKGCTHAADRVVRLRLTRAFRCRAKGALLLSAAAWAGVSVKSATA